MATPHPIANLFPMLDADCLKALADDINENGLHHPIILFEGQILDGRNRLAACKIASVEPRFTIFEGTEAEALSLVISLNLQRRHLTTAQKAVLALRLLPHEQRLAETRMLAGIAANPHQDADEGAVQHGQALELAGAHVGVSRDTVWKARRVAEEAPEVFEAMQDGTLTSVASAVKLAALPLSKRRRLLTRIRNEGLTLAQAESIYRRGAGEHHTNWFTPPEVIEAVVLALGGPIDLDPASCEQANEIVGAARYYSAQDDGLAPGVAGRAAVPEPALRAERQWEQPGRLGDQGARRVRGEPLPEGHIARQKQRRGRVVLAFVGAPRVPGSGSPAIRAGAGDSP